VVGLGDIFRRHAELRELAEVDGPWWWLVAAGAAVRWRGNTVYVSSDAEPASDTFIGVRRPRPAHPLARAHGARDAIRALDGTLPHQPLAVTVRRTDRGARVIPSTLSTVAFAIGDRVIRYRLAASLGAEPPLAPERDTSDEVPFACISLGDEPIETARHGHRRAWRDDAGPWLGLGRSGELDVISTCHMVVDGYGHARLAALLPGGDDATSYPPLAASSGAIPLNVTWRDVPSGPRTLALAYQLGCMFHRPPARFSPTLMLPFAPDVASRLHFALASVRFHGAAPEPFDSFARRTKAAPEREADGDGITERLMAAATGVTVPVAWKRRAMGARRPGWLEPVAEVLGGRACVSRIDLPAPYPGACAVSSPARLATADDPLGSCVVTVLDDGIRASITLCGSGDAAAPHRLDELLRRVQGI